MTVREAAQTQAHRVIDGATGRAPRARTAAEILLWGRTTIEPALREAVETLPPTGGRVAAYLFGLAEERNDPTRVDHPVGLRSALTLLCARAAGGPPQDRAVPAAVAVELVHGFALLRDELTAGDVPAHRPAAWAVFGHDETALAGDALLALALDLLAAAGPIGPPPATPATASLPAPLSCAPRPSAPRILAAAVQRLIAARGTESQFARRATVDLAECVRIAEDRTAALVGCACALGAWYGHGTTAQVGQLHRFGDKLGLAVELATDPRCDAVVEELLGEALGHLDSARPHGSAAADLRVLAAAAVGGR